MHGPYPNSHIAVAMSKGPSKMSPWPRTAVPLPHLAPGHLCLPREISFYPTPRKSSGGLRLWTEGISLITGREARLALSGTLESIPEGGQCPQLSPC